MACLWGFFLRLLNSVFPILLTKPAIEFLILQQEFNGPGPARNAGLKVARNPWIIFCDSDDVLWVDRVCEELHGVKSSDEFIIGNYSVKSNN
ncbi:MAG: glycosyltransferase family 2 protein, partial [Betaproteobacteria bacterium]|nr:glycosyltransferase family 2 protein [Betaproteobacteria bacterium]